MIKMILGTVAGAGANQVITNIVKHTTPGDLKKMKKIFTGIGGFVLASYVGTAVEKRTGEMIDDIVKIFNEEPQED